MGSISKNQLLQLYGVEKHSVREIAAHYHCSENKINYWISKYAILKRSISEAIYIQRNPNGDPFLFTPPATQEDVFLFGLGLGLYWGEGNKKNKGSIRLGNTDPRLVKKFIEFLVRLYAVPEKKFRFGLQIFSDMSSKDALTFWAKTLGVSPKQFIKVIRTPARAPGTYREKTKHGVLTVYVSNKKLRDLVVGEIEKL